MAQGCSDGRAQGELCWLLSSCELQFGGAGAEDPGSLPVLQLCCLPLLQEPPVGPETLLLVWGKLSLLIHHLFLLLSALWPGCCGILHTWQGRG